MNVVADTQLKILIERAVRPVRATLGRKRRTREELLVQVTADFAEEAKRGDETAALEERREIFT